MKFNSGYPPEVLHVAECNQRACKRFADARIAFESDFELALKYIAGYRGLLDPWLFFRADNRPAGAKSVSVVVVGFNTGHELVACLESLFSEAPQETEIIVVDNGGNAEVLPALLSMPLLYIKAPTNLFPSEARNIGAIHATAPLLIFIDDDALATPGLFSHARRAFNDPAVLAVEGRIKPKFAGENSLALAHEDLGDTPKPARISYETVCAWRRKEYLAVGGMDPLLFGHEGEELSLRLLDYYPEAKLLYYPDMVVLHDLVDSAVDHSAKSARHQQMSRYFTWKRRRDVQKIVGKEP